MDLKEKLTKFRRIQPVHVDELGCEVYVRRMTGTEANAYQTAQAKAQKDFEAGGGDAAFLPLFAVLLSLTVCDADGNLIFEKPEDANRMDVEIRDQLTTAAQHVNGMTFEAREEIKKKSVMNGSGISSPTVGEEKSKT